ncbi:MAG: hypothetical protein ISR47_08615 [Rhodospirillales bacterium]|nr:hypothetical protein [Rhodospirillales bacterium]
MLDPNIITKVHGVEVWHHRDQTRPSTYLRVQADTQTGRLVLSLSISAAKQLKEDLERTLREGRFQ